MKHNILIICLLLVLLNCENEFYLSLEMLLSGNSKYKLTLNNRKEGTSDNDLFYSGFAEDIEKILIDRYNRKDGYETLKNEKHPLVYMMNLCILEYINYFSTDTIFVVDEKCNIYKSDISNYNVFSIEDNSNYFQYLIAEESIYYIKIGKDLDLNMEIFFYIILGLSMLISIFLSFIMKKILKNMDEENILLINFLICHISDLLFLANIGNSISFLFFMGRDSLDFLSEYVIVFLLALYKGSFYTTAILLLKGWMTTTFIPLGDNFKKYYKRLLLYELVVSLLLHLSIYFINISSKLNLFYIKSELEQIAFLSYIIYCIIKKMIPLYKQMKYEQSIRSDLVKCIRFKFKKLFFTYLLFGIYSLWIMIFPIIEKQLIYSYIYNYHLHYVLQIFIEAIFCIGLNIIFIPKKLPRYFFDEIVYNYRELVYLEADVYEGDDEENHNKKLNISKLSFNILKKASKKDDYPIVFINPFASSRDMLLFNHIHIGIPQRYKKN